MIRFLQAQLGLAKTSLVADVGSGTGIFTSLLVDHCRKVFAVEPNDAMRAAGERILGGHSSFVSTHGSAEATGLPDHSVSIVTCAQAFHWFDVGAARKEFIRILSPSGGCALIWNTPVIGKSEFALGYERIKEEFGTDFKRIRHETIEKEGRFDAFFGVGRWKKECFENFQILDLGGLRGRLLSSSYAPKEGQPRFVEMMSALSELFNRTRKDGVIRMDYTTEVFYGPMR